MNTHTLQNAVDKNRENRM